MSSIEERRRQLRQRKLAAGSAENRMSKLNDAVTKTVEEEKHPNSQKKDKEAEKKIERASHRSEATASSARAGSAQAKRSEEASETPKGVFRLNLKTASVDELATAVVTSQISLKDFGREMGRRTAHAAPFFLNSIFYLIALPLAVCVSFFIAFDTSQCVHFAPFQRHPIPSLSDARGSTGLVAFMATSGIIAVLLETLLLRTGAMKTRTTDIVVDGWSSLQWVLFSTLAYTFGRTRTLAHIFWKVVVFVVGGMFLHFVAVAGGCIANA
uniref:Uncharacterized protein n=1 Tax=Palpitomonas bilix TaxID=652834 RepID=A0A7S3FYI4_9EUKA|mmetsp:Transcript_10272/g.26918  ORF Transcript_10272/g.26918 Transcript_10272/m.26918 type:complete len:269 (+) Transcript_10272:109-915(+)